MGQKVRGRAEPSHKGEYPEWDRPALGSQAGEALSSFIAITETLKLGATRHISRIRR